MSGREIGAADESVAAIEQQHLDGDLCVLERMGCRLRGGARGRVAEPHTFLRVP